MNDYTINFSSKTSQSYFSRIKSKTKVITGVAAGIFLFILLFGFIKNKMDPSLITPLAATKEVKGESSETKETVQNQIKSVDELKKHVSEVVSPLGGTFSLYVYDIKQNTDFGIDEDTIYMAASVNKLPILASVYHLAASKEIDLDKTITIQAKDIQDYGTGSIRYDSPGTVYSIRTLARLMMEKSDNTAAFLLGSHIVGLSKIQLLVESWGLTQTDMNENKTSPKDIGKLFLKMYKGEITSRALNAEMIGFTDESDFEDRIPRELPKEVTVYHKIGDEVGKIHDAGIVDLPKRPYFIGLFTTDMTDDETTKEILAKVSKIVFDYMNR